MILIPYISMKSWERIPSRRTGRRAASSGKINTMKRSGSMKYDLTLFIREGEEGLFRRYEETHYQRGYTLEEIKTLLKEAGLDFVAAWDGFCEQPAQEDSERILVAAREQGKADRIK